MASRLDASSSRGSADQAPLSLARAGPLKGCLAQAAVQRAPVLPPRTQLRICERCCRRRACAAIAHALLRAPPVLLLRSSLLRAAFLHVSSELALRGGQPCLLAVALLLPRAALLPLALLALGPAEAAAACAEPLLLLRTRSVGGEVGHALLAVALLILVTL